MEPEILWEHAQSAVEELFRQQADEKLLGLGFSFFGDSLIPVDENCKPLSNLIMAFDTRASKRRDRGKSISGNRGRTMPVYAGLFKTALASEK